MHCGYGRANRYDPQSHVLSGFHYELIRIPWIIARKGNQADLDLPQVFDLAIAVPFLRGILNAFQSEVFTADEMQIAHVSRRNTLQRLLDHLDVA